MESWMLSAPSSSSVPPEPSRERSSKTSPPGPRSSSIPVKAPSVATKFPPWDPLRPELKEPKLTPYKWLKWFGNDEYRATRLDERSITETAHDYVTAVLDQRNRDMLVGIISTDQPPALPDRLQCQFRCRCDLFVYDNWHLHHQDCCSIPGYPVDYACTSERYGQMIGQKGLGHRCAMPKNHKGQHLC